MIINEFDLTTPKEDDPLSTADDEIRSIKGALLATFPYFDSAFTVKFSDVNKFFQSASVSTDGKVKLDTPKYKPIVDSKRLYVNNSGTVIYTPPLPPLGSVIKTVLTLAQLDTIYGAGVFVYIDGSSTAGTNIFKFTSPTGSYTSTGNISITPTGTEKRTYFIRQSDTDANIDKPTPSSLGPPIGGNSTTTPSVSHQHWMQHQHTINPYPNTYWQNLDDGGNAAQHMPYVDDIYLFTSTSKVTNTSTDKDWSDYATHTHTVTYAGSVEGETRPKNISLNFYLRVN